MARAIDRLPPPAAVRPMKVIGLGASRTGTMGLWLALKILGYHPYHVGESIRSGVGHMRALQEAMVAGAADKPLTRDELGRLWGDYDCLVECPSYLGTTSIETFLEDPDVKFILTERSPESFVRSICGAQCEYWARLNSPGLLLARWLDGSLREVERILRIQIRRWSGGRPLDDPGFKGAVAKSYVEHNERVKSMIPPERLLVVSLEKGFGWDEICGFLGHDIPGTPYPRVWSLGEFQKASERHIARGIQKSKSVLAATAAVVVTAVIWYIG